MKIGKKGYPSSGVSYNDRLFFRSSETGRLMFCVKDWERLTSTGSPVWDKYCKNRSCYYDDNSGSYRVDVFVFSSPDVENNAQALKAVAMVNEADQDLQEAIAGALSEINRHKTLQLASSTASKEIDETKQAIEKLKEQSKKEGIEPEKKEPTHQTKSVPIDSKPRLSKDKKIAQLEAKLSELTETLKQLEEMKKELEQGREKIDLLSQELEEKKMLEKNLLERLEDSQKHLPVIVVAAPKDGNEVEVGTITFSGVTEDEEGLKGLEIFINDNPLLTKVSRDIKVVGIQYPRRLEFAERILLQRGKNEIRIHATNTNGLTASKTLTVHYREMRKNVWAVVIGIDNYQKIRHLRYAVNDARAFYEHLIHNNHIPEENVTLMINEEASSNRLRSTLGTHLRNKASKEDMVIIYFAGHGATERDVTSPDGDGLEKYILPHDADLKDLYGSALPMIEISRIFNRIRSERLIFIADACYSGASGGRTISSTGMRANISDGFLDRIASGKGRVILTASGPNETSTENDELKHGVFTYFLLEGLRGKADIDTDGIITVDEVYRYVSKEVPKATEQRQHPIKKGIVEGQLILGLSD